MKFDPGIKVGDKITNKELSTVFKCGNMGGMRRSKATGTLVIISDETKGLYQDIWKNGILHYTGMGKIGDQDLEWSQNKTLCYSNTNGVEVHLFEVEEKKLYTYRGVVTLVDNPYETRQRDEEGNMRRVWIFPVKPENDAISAEELGPSEEKMKSFSDGELARRVAVKSVGKNTRVVSTVEYSRDRYLKEMVKRIAEGKCQLCGKEAPFYDKNNEPYLEEHHVVRLADGGKDSMDNVVAICPNCHRKMHVLDKIEDKEALLNIAKKNMSAFKRILYYANEIIGDDE